MLLQLHLRIHPRKRYMRAVVFTRADIVKQTIIFIYKIFPSFKVSENPVLKLILYNFLLLHRCGGLLSV